MTHDDPLGGRHGLQRHRTDRVLGGVCAGIAEPLDLDPLLVQVAAVDLALVSGGDAVSASSAPWIPLCQIHERIDRDQSTGRPAEEVVLP